MTSTAVPLYVAPARLPSAGASNVADARWERWIPPWVRAIGAPVWVTGEGGRIVFMNGRAETLLGVTAREAVGRACHGVVASRTPCGAAFCGPRCRIVVDADAGAEVEPVDVRIGARPGREQHSIQITPIPVESPDGTLRWIVHVVRIDDRARRIESYVERIARRSEAIRDIDADDARRPLSPRETDVLDLLAKDEPPSRIAAILGLSYVTVRNHVQHLLAKLGAHSVDEAVAMHVLART